MHVFDQALAEQLYRETEGFRSNVGFVEDSVVTENCIYRNSTEGLAQTSRVMNIEV